MIQNARTGCRPSRHPTAVAAMILHGGPNDQVVVGFQMISEEWRDDLKARGHPARASESIDDIVSAVAREHRPGDLVVLMSNGGFGGIHQKLLRALA